MSLPFRMGVHRAALLERILALRPREEATAEVQLEPFEALFAHGVPTALWLELLAEVASLTFPHRSLARFRDVSLQNLPPGASRKVLCRATSGGDERVRVQLLLSQEGGPTHELASAMATMSDSLGVPPMLPAHDLWAVDRRQRPANGDALYVPTGERPFTVPPSRQTVRWAYQSGLGQLVARIGARVLHFDKYPVSTQMHATPGIVEAVEQLAVWQWYALAGAGAQVRRIARLDWFRAPRPDEELVAVVSCCGNVNNQPTYEAVVCGLDLHMVLQVDGLELASESLGATKPPRTEWNSFIRVLDGMGHTLSK